MKASSSPHNVICEALERLELFRGGAEIRPFASGLFETWRVNLPGGPLLAKIVPAAVGEAEKDGLDALAQSGARVPCQHGFVKIGAQGVLVMELVEQGRMKPELFLHGLFARAESYGYKRDNFIGSLPQTNGTFERFSDFYWQARLKPQLSRAMHGGLLDAADLKKAENLTLSLCAQWHLDRQAPRLIHGDLWDGNLLFNQSGESVFIDPAVAWSNPEQDLAMLELFGSHSQDLLDECARKAGCPEGRAERRSFFQLYPLLVHVNLFGASYVQRFRRCMSEYL